MTEKTGQKTFHIYFCRRDLERMQRSLIERRKELKRQIRIFEVGFEDNNGRPPRTEEEKSPLEKTYRAYKEVKARMRLIEALIQKQEKAALAQQQQQR
jgi:hypothetical protein